MEDSQSLESSQLHYSVNTNGGLEITGSTSAIPAELVTDPKVITNRIGEANNFRLKRGQFRITFRAQKTADTEVLIEKIRDKMVYVNSDEGPKRLYIYYSVAQDGEPAGGEETVKIIATFVLLDNFVWLVPALYALTAAISVVGGWFLVDKVESFSHTTIGTISIVTAAALSIFIIYKTW